MTQGGQCRNVCGSAARSLVIQQSLNWGGTGNSWGKSCLTSGVQTGTETGGQLWSGEVRASL